MYVSATRVVAVIRVCFLRGFGSQFELAGAGIGGHCNLRGYHCSHAFDRGAPDLELDVPSKVVVFSVYCL